jgi:hypothetical protein
MSETFLVLSLFPLDTVMFCAEYLCYAQGQFYYRHAASPLPFDLVYRKLIPLFTSTSCTLQENPKKYVWTR